MRIKLVIQKRKRKTAGEKLLRKKGLVGFSEQWGHRPWKHERTDRLYSHRCGKEMARFGGREMRMLSCFLEGSDEKRGHALRVRKSWHLGSRTRGERRRRKGKATERAGAEEKA